MTLDLKYPIGKFECEEKISTEQVSKWIEEIRLLPEQLIEAVKYLTEDALDQPYRENGWTIRQVVHHLADSHSNAYTRFKFALTEDTPTIKPYDQDKWAELIDSKIPISSSLKIIEGLHDRMAYLLENLTEEQRKRNFHHPDSGLVSIEKNIGIYAWHGKHHLAHIQNALLT
ncbi:YfiT family bacillithiol transferase [Viridibacillus soli]|uniref:YfiT family bacillithiol transferase n=1 Tax=Viridibacillus soli TaxID=2798301 RepID=UPI002D806633|nr:bacillithiol transferase BstA [Viridibacillus soli]